MPLLKLVSRCAYHVISRQGLSDPLQLELAHGLDRHGVLDLRQHPRTNQDLPSLRLIAKPRGNIRHRPDGGVIEASLEPDGAERGEAVRDANAEANVLSEPTTRSFHGKRHHEAMRWQSRVMPRNFFRCPDQSKWPKRYGGAAC
jgi:hypothetical protein